MHSGHEALLEACHDLDVRLGCKVEYQRQIGFEGTQGRQRLHVIADADLKLHQWMTLPKSGNRTRQGVRRQSLAGQNVDLTATQSLQFFNLRPDLFEIGLTGAHMMDKQLAGRRQAHAARQSLEQRQAKFRFQILDAPVYRRRRDVQALGRETDGPGACDFVEIPQESKMVHAVLAYR